MTVPTKIVVAHVDTLQCHEPIALGGKARSLAALSAAGFQVPPFFVVIAETIPTSREWCEQVAEACRALPSGGTLAVRSSGADEDSAGHSFAGQFESFLFVKADGVPEKIEAIWASANSDRVRAYRDTHGLPAVAAPPCVIVQAMIDADSAGVVFSADPVSGRRSIAVVSAVKGVGEALVSGERDADTFRIDQSGSIIESVKADAAICRQQAIEIAELARRAEAHFGVPQDIEWAIHDGSLFLLQSRPITSLESTPDPDGALAIWDNSNIAESYSGVTTPLTFTFARRAYEAVYRQFCLLMRVPRKRVENTTGVFENMLGLIRGRVYYNLINWYRVLALLPGFQLNREFMEQMMGVKEPMPDEIVREITASRTDGRLKDGLQLASTVLGLAINHFTLPKQIREFYARLGEALELPPERLASMRMDELFAHYNALEHRLLRRWDAPLVNDFLAMIFFGALAKLTKNWLGDEKGTLHNSLIGGEGGIISMEPARRIREMAEMASDNPDLLRDLESSADLISHEEFASAYRNYLEKFGDRCLEELKLESETLDDDDSLLKGSIRALARRYLDEGPPSKDSIDAVNRGEAEALVAGAQIGKLKRVVFHWVLRNARVRVRDRENLRFERTRVFGRVRKIMVELGKRFVAEGWLAEPRDIFYLELGEILAVGDAALTSTPLSAAAATRKASFEAFRQTEEPPDRFETRGPVQCYRSFVASRPLTESTGDERTGIGCCPGVVRGKVRVVLDPQNAQLEPGSILVARQTDPGWVMLFPSASGLLVERGSLLSHSAIVSREMGIPSIVSIPGITNWLNDGDEVEIDGASGVVRRLITTRDG